MGRRGDPDVILPPAGVKMTKRWLKAHGLKIRYGSGTWWLERK